MTDPIRSVAIVGSGPAALIAAWACNLQGVRAKMFSDTGEPSTIHGAQYLHSMFVLPGGRHVYETPIRFVKIGTRRGYSEKIYGPGFDPSETSWDKFPQRTIKGWPLRTVYAILWDALGQDVHRWEIYRQEMSELCMEFDLVINTAPAHLFAVEGAEHTFESVKIIQAPTRLKMYTPTVIYHGGPEEEWYRSSLLEGVRSYEFPGDWQGEATTVAKPLSISGPPMHDNIMPVGRYGKWKKGELVDGVFKEVSQRLGGGQVLVHPQPRRR